MVAVRSAERVCVAETAIHSNAPLPTPSEGEVESHPASSGITVRQLPLQRSVICLDEARQLAKRIESVSRTR